MREARHGRLIVSPLWHHPSATPVNRPVMSRHGSPFVVNVLPHLRRVTHASLVEEGRQRERDSRLVVLQYARVPHVCLEDREGHEAVTCAGQIGLHERHRELTERPAVGLERLLGGALAKLVQQYNGDLDRLSFRGQINCQGIIKGRGRSIVS